MKIEMKKKDAALAAIIIGVALLAFLAHELIGSEGAGKVVIKVNGELEGTYSLAEDQEIEINGGSNKLLIKNGKADMIEADCPDQLCVHQKPVSLRNESIICLPNKVVVEIGTSESSELDAVTN